MSESKSAYPRFGAMITMIVGLILFFAAVSQIGRLTQTRGLLQASQSEAKDDTKAKLKAERDKAFAVIGGERTDGLDSDADPVDETPAVDEQVNPDPIPQNPAPRRRVDPAPRQHVVQQNETLYGIARRYYEDGNKWTLIKKANPGLNPAALRKGDILTIPPLDASHASAPSSGGSGL